MRYLKRIADGQLSLKLDAFGGALIIGPKGCGKTTTAKQKAKSVVEFQDEDERENYLLIANTHQDVDLVEGGSDKDSEMHIWNPQRNHMFRMEKISIWLTAVNSEYKATTPVTFSYANTAWFWRICIE